MTPDQDSAAILQAVLMSTATFLLVAKICRECWADSLRRRLSALDFELFEVARRGRIGFREPAFIMLRDSIRSIVEASHRISLVRILAIVLIRHVLVPRGLVANHVRRWHEAVNQVESESALEEIIRIHERVLIAICASMVPRWIPLPSLLSAPVLLLRAWHGVCDFSAGSPRIAEARLKHSRRMATTA